MDKKIEGIKIFDQYEIKKFLEPFNGEHVDLKIRDINLVDIELKRATIEITPNNLIFEGKDYKLDMFFMAINFLNVDESSRIAFVTIYLKNNTSLTFAYENI